METKKRWTMNVLKFLISVMIQLFSVKIIYCIDADAMRHHQLSVKIRKFRCSRPIEIPVLVKLEANDPIGTRYDPSHVPLSRCGNHSGCCKPSFECKPTKINYVQYTLMRMPPGLKHGSFVNMTFSNHLKCSCESICGKNLCPHPFTNYIIPYNPCSCVCRPYDKYCHGIYNGLLRLNDEEKTCIQELRCLPPSCSREKIYDKFLGKCIDRINMISKLCN